MSDRSPNYKGMYEIRYKQLKFLQKTMYSKGELSCKLSAIIRECEHMKTCTYSLISKAKNAFSYTHVNSQGVSEIIVIGYEEDRTGMVAGENDEYCISKYKEADLLLRRTQEQRLSIRIEVVEISEKIEDTEREMRDIINSMPLTERNFDFDYVGDDGKVEFVSVTYVDNTYYMSVNPLSLE